jgi:hypothetical protein
MLIFQERQTCDLQLIVITYNMRAIFSLSKATVGSLQQLYHVGTYQAEYNCINVFLSFPAPDCPDRMVTHKKVPQEVCWDKQNLQGTLNAENNGKATTFGMLLDFGVKDPVVLSTRPITVHCTVQRAIPKCHCYCPFDNCWV